MLKFLYFKNLKYSKQSIKLIKKKFKLIEKNFPTKTIQEQIKDTVVLSAPLGFNFDETFLSKFKNLKVIVSNTTSIPHIDEEYCKNKKIYISALHNDKTFLKNITPTAEHNLGLILAITRNLIPSYKSVLNYEWNRKNWGGKKMLSESTVGIVGMGRIGKILKKYLIAIGCKVIFYDPNVKGGEKNLINMVKKIDILSINASANKKNYKIINNKVLSKMKKNSYIINTARGELLDTDALIKFMKNKKIAGAALDTIEGEYDQINFKKNKKRIKLINYSKKNTNLIITPHIAGSTYDAWYKTEKRVINKTINFLKL